MIPRGVFDLPFLSLLGHDTRVSNWATRVVANGGAYPSEATLNALDTFVVGMDSAGLWAKMAALNIMAPDSLTAMITPLLVGSGNDPWTNSGFTGGACTVNGLVGDGLHVLNTGIAPSSLSNTSAGMTLYSYTGPVIAGHDNSSSPDFILSSSTFDCWDNSTSRQLQLVTNAGFHSGSRTASGQSDTYHGTSLLTTLLHNSTQTTGSSQNNSTLTAPIHLMAVNHNNLVDLFISTGTCSFFAIHQGLSSGDTQSFFTLVEALRVTFGGGYTDPANEWGLRVVANGGAAPGSTTKNALNTFYSGLVSDGLLGSAGVVNCFAPDSLVAAQTPFLIGLGLDPWTNHSFVSGDLTVNGLVGNASSKWMDTGFLPTLLSPGIGMAWYVSSVGAAGVELSCTDASHFFQATSKYSDGHAYFFDNQNGVAIASPSGLGGFYAQNRVSTTDHRAWFANSGNAFAQIGATDTVAFGAFPSWSCYAFANNAVGTAQQFSSSRLSFAALTYQMTSTQLSNLYNRVQTLRTALGGGFV